MKSTPGTQGLSRTRIFVLAALSGTTLSAAALAQGPAGEQVVAGSAQFARNGSLTQITTSQTAIINYQSFNVAAGHTVQFIQPNAQARVLNRVLGPDPSQIAGTIQANGQVYLVNPAGVTFHNGAIVNVGALYAAAGSIANSDFLAGSSRFTNLTGTVRNEGLIQASRAVLAGAKVENLGSVNAPGGTVVFAAGDSVFIGQNGSAMYARVEGGSAGNGVTNTGSVNAAGGTAIAATGDVFGMAIRHGGQIKAARAELRGGANTYTAVTGSIDATNAAGRGGSVQIAGQTVAVLDGATINASGRDGGGQVHIGGAWQGQGPDANARDAYVARAATIRADATGSGKGGEVVVWSDRHTAVYGEVSAAGRGPSGDGGRIETSGKQWLDVAGARVSAPGSGSGHAGLWLLDPVDITVSSGATSPGGSFDTTTGVLTLTNEAVANINVTDLATALQSNDVTINSNASAAIGPAGNITLQDALSVNLSAARTLTLNANGNAGASILFSSGASITATGAALNLILNANNLIGFSGAATYALNGGNANFTAFAYNFTTTTFSGIANFTTDGSPGVSGGITLDGNLAITATTSVSLGGNASGSGTQDLTITGGAGSVSLGGLSNLRDVSLPVGSGTTTFNGPVSSVRSLDNRRTGAITIRSGQDVTGDLRHDGPVTFDFTFVTISAANITFNSSVDGSSSQITLNSAGDTIIAGAVGAGGDVESIVTDAPGTLSIGSVRTRGAQTFNESVVTLTGSTYDSTNNGAFAAGGNIRFNTATSDILNLDSNVTVTTGNSTFTFAGEINSAGSNRSLAVSGAGGSFGNHIGGADAASDTLRLSSFRVTSAGLVTFGSSAPLAIRTAANTGAGTPSDASDDAVAISAPIALARNLLVDTGSGTVTGVTFGGTVDSTSGALRTLTLRNQGLVTFTGVLGGTNALGDVSTGTATFGTIALRRAVFASSLALGNGTELILGDGGATGETVTINTPNGFSVGAATVTLADDIVINAGSSNAVFGGAINSDDEGTPGTFRDLTVNSTADVLFAGNIGGDASLATTDERRLDVLTIGSTGARANRVLFGSAALGSPAAAGTAFFVSTQGDQRYFSNLADASLGLIVGADATFQTLTGGVAFDANVNADRKDLSRNLTVLTPGSGPSATITFVRDLGLRGDNGVADNGAFQTVTLNTPDAPGRRIELFSVRTFGDQAYSADVITLRALDVSIVNSAQLGSAPQIGGFFVANELDPNLGDAGTGNITFGSSNAALTDLQALVLDLASTDRTARVNPGQNAFFLSTIDSLNDSAGTIGSLVVTLPTAGQPQFAYRTQFAGSIGAGNAPRGITAGRLERLVSDGPAGTFTQFGGLIAPGPLSPADLLVLTRGSGTQIYNNAVRLSTSVSYADSLAGDINFNSTIDGVSDTDPTVFEQGTRSISVSTRGVTRFRQSIGAQGRLNEIVTDAAYTGGRAPDAGETGPGSSTQNRLVFGRSTAGADDLAVLVQTSGQQQYNDPHGIRLGASVTFSADTGDLTFNTTINADAATRDPGSGAQNVYRDLTIRTGGRVTLNASIGDGDAYTTAGDALSESGTTPGLVPDNFAQAGPGSDNAAAIRPNTITISNLDASSTAVATAALQLGTAQTNGTLRAIRSRGAQTYNYSASTAGIIFQQDTVFSSNNSVATPAAGTNNITFNGPLVADTAADPVANVGRRITVNTAGLTAFNGLVGGNTGAGTINTNRFLTLTTDARAYVPGTQPNGSRGAEFGGSTQFGHAVFLSGANIDGPNAFYIDQAAVPGVSAAVQYRRLSGLVINDAVIINPIAAAANVVTIDTGASSMWFRQGITRDASASASTRLSLISTADSLLVGADNRLTANSFQALSSANRAAYLRGYQAPIAIGGDIGSTANRFGAVTFNTANPTSAPTTDARFQNLAARGDATNPANVPVLSTILFANLSGAYGSAARLADLPASPLPANQPLNFLFTDDGVAGSTPGNLGSLATATGNTFRVFTSGNATGQGITFAQNEKVLALGSLELLSGTGAAAGNIILGDLNAAASPGGSAGNLVVGEASGAAIRVVQRAASKVAVLSGLGATLLADSGVDFIAAGNITFSAAPQRAGNTAAFSPGLTPQFSTGTGGTVTIAGDASPAGYTIRQRSAPLVAADPDGLILLDYAAEGTTLVDETGPLAGSENQVGFELFGRLPLQPFVRRTNRWSWLTLERGNSVLSEDQVLRAVRAGRTGLTPPVRPTAPTSSPAGEPPQPAPQASLPPGRGWDR